MAKKKNKKDNLLQQVAKWNNLPTTVIRIPKVFEDKLRQYARDLDGDLVDESLVSKSENKIENSENRKLEEMSLLDLESEILKLNEQLCLKRKEEKGNLEENRIEINKDRVMLYFEYNKKLVERAKEIKGASFDWDNKYWGYPLDRLEEVIEKFPKSRPSEAIIKWFERKERKEQKEREKAELEQKAYQDWLTDLLSKSVLDVSLKNGWTLFEHQKEGVRWLLERVKQNGYRGAILADQMGLGKTYTALYAAVLLGARENVDIIVICPASLKTVWTDAAKKVGVKITVNSWAKFPVLSKDKRFILICDEAHYAQNLTTARTQKMLAFVTASNCDACYLLSGTPIKNGRPINLFPLLVACDHGFANDLEHYRNHFCDLHYDGYGMNDKGASNLDELHEGIKPILLRRTKEECLDLPEKIRSLIPMVVKKREKDGYKEAIDELKRRRQERIEQGLTGKNNSHLGEMAMLRHAASVAKIPTAIEFCEELIEQGNKVVIFSEFKDTANLVSKSLNACLLTGETPQKQRGDLVSDFQAGKYDAFVGTIGAGGVGITLTAASYVVLIDRPWSPGDAVQVEDRCHRIGQDSSVHAFWLQLPFGLDKAIDNLLRKKQQNIDKVLTGEFQEDFITEEINSLVEDYLAQNKL